MPAETRAKLATVQAELVSALAGHCAPPPGFDAARIHTAAIALATNRMRAVARTWPGLGEALGRVFAERFRQFAVKNPLPHVGGALADGRAFVRWHSMTYKLPVETYLETLAVDLRY